MNISASPIERSLSELGKHFDGQLYLDPTTRKLYSTDASIYQEIPAGVAVPKSTDDIRRLIRLANENRIGLIPRTAGTSLAGQVVGSGLIVDISRYFTEIVEINPDQKWVRVQPGVIRNELNMAMAKHGLMFGPETSTASRAMLGGMLGNNSCGANSIVYGTTRDQTISVRGFLSDGSEAEFGPMSAEAFARKCELGNGSLEAKIYRGMYQMLADETNRKAISAEFPKKNIQRRNTGYALDLLMESAVFGVGDLPLNMCKLIAGSEGTLFLATEIKLQCHPLPPRHTSLLCAHFHNIGDAMRATQIAMTHSPFRCELIDRLVLEGAARNLELREFLAFVTDTPEAILLVESRAESLPAANRMSATIAEELKANGLGFHFPMFADEASEPIWNLRKAGLGVVGNIPGDSKPVTVIEDTAVDIDDLPDFIEEVDALLRQRYDCQCVHYGHAGAGEIHLRPVLNLKTAEDRQKLKAMASDMAAVVKKYKGSLSGEHGDGRLRSEFLEQMIGHHNYQLVCQVKKLWDPENIFNPNKIVHPVAMDAKLRFEATAGAADPKTVFDFRETGGLLRAAEMCTGSGDCRKTELSGGTMCPSYMATRNEQHTTRARANILRHVLTDPADWNNPLNSQEIKQVMDLCLSCKGCKSECPSNVDVAKMKAEFLQGYYDANGVPRRTRMIASMERFSRVASNLPWLYNFFATSRVSSWLLKKFIGFHPQRTLPRLHSKTLRSWFKSHKAHARAGDRGKVFLFCDEFSNYFELPIGIATVQLLERLGFAVEIPRHRESGRAAISSGLLRQAREIAEQNVRMLAGCTTEDQPLVGIEPSAILSFRDEYPSLVRTEFRNAAERLSGNTFLIEEFLVRQLDKGTINSGSFHLAPKQIFLHGHCFQKALGTLASHRTRPSDPPPLQRSPDPVGMLRNGRFFWLRNRTL